MIITVSHATIEAALLILCHAGNYRVSLCFEWLLMDTYTYILYMSGRMTSCICKAYDMLWGALLTRME